MPMFPFYILVILIAWSFIDEVRKGHRMGLSTLQIWSNPPPKPAIRTYILIFVALAYAGAISHSSGS